ncbi:MAG: hypothetical protein FWD63_01375 [Propionibacteriaceae bacterium]|nr:hypothetical protein [Propionibacteriaceae bacterium]
MDGEIQLFSDGDGLAVFGEAADVDRFLASSGLASTQIPVASLVSRAGAAVTAASELAANSGRWVKLTEQSARAIRQVGLRTSGKTGLATGVLKGKSGQIKGFVEFVKAPATLGANLLNPAVLASVGTLMQQQAMMKTMEEIKEYLAEIEAKVDDIIRAQNDAVLAQMIGVGLILDEAVEVRDSVGRVSEITWSKVQGAAATVASTQAYALRQIEALTAKVEVKSDLDDITKAVNAARPKVQEWLAVLARCVQLQDALAVIELDRVLDATPEEVERHRSGLKTARQKRLEQMAGTTGQLLARLDASTERANSAVLWNPMSSPRVVAASHRVASDVVKFDELLGIGAGHEALSAKAWTVAVGEAKDKVLEVGAAGLRAGGQTVGRGVDAFRAIDRNNDGIPEKPQVLAALETAGSAVTGAGSAVKGAAVDAAGAVGELIRKSKKATPEDD